ncbi:MAG: SsrA-binding protein SmpB [Oscillospiraceae bacterium]|nr:SsrA-binding protein SmpB [Oscillospiraceae bacterium]
MNPEKRDIASNRKAYHDYFILDRYEAGIELAGTEVKSIRAGNINLKDSFCTIKNNEIFIRGMHISPYSHGNIFNKDPVRPRKLLMHKKEIARLNARIMQDGVALIPLSVYFKGSLIKVELGLCKGKKLHDKRDSEAEKESRRNIERTLKEGRYSE